MSSNMKFISKDIDRLAKFMKTYPKVTEKYARLMIEKSLFTLEREAKLHAPKNENTLAKGIRSNPGNTAFNGEVVATTEYSIFVHDGTRPHFPPIKPGGSLDRWAKKRGLNTYLVARAIAKRGTKAQPFMDEALESGQGEVYKYFKQMLDAITNEIIKA